MFFLSFFDPLCKDMAAMHQNNIIKEWNSDKNNLTDNIDMKTNNNHEILSCQVKCTQ